MISLARVHTWLICFRCAKVMFCGVMVECSKVPLVLSEFVDFFLAQRVVGAEAVSSGRRALLDELPGLPRKEEIVDELYLPIYLYIKHCLFQQSKSPIVIGVTAPQGCGKTTLSRVLCSIFSAEGVRAISISVDDFYLTNKEQKKVALKYPKCPRLQQRGYPGTHDIQLGVDTVEALLQSFGKVDLPRYDKSAFKGAGDRHQKDLWEVVDLPLDIIFLEGWMLGFQPVRHPGELSVINNLLRGYKQWDVLIDKHILLFPDSYGYVVEWRAEAEQKMRATTGKGMSDSAVRLYASQFLLAYETYYPQLRDRLLAADGSLVVDIGKNRLPLS